MGKRGNAVPVNIFVRVLERRWGMCRANGNAGIRALNSPTFIMLNSFALLGSGLLHFVTRVLQIVTVHMDMHCRMQIDIRRHLLTSASVNGAGRQIVARR